MKNQGAVLRNHIKTAASIGLILGAIFGIIESFVIYSFYSPLFNFTNILQYLLYWISFYGLAGFVLGFGIGIFFNFLFKVLPLKYNVRKLNALYISIFIIIILFFISFPISNNLVWNIPIFTSSHFFSNLIWNIIMIAFFILIFYLLFLLLKRIKLRLTFKFKIIGIIVLIFLVLNVAINFYESKKEGALETNPVFENDEIESYNIIFIVVDALRADHLGVYGYERNTSPNIDEFAKESILFKKGTSVSSCTLPTMPLILTGKYTIEDVSLKESEITLPEVLKDSGYKTGGFFVQYIMTRYGVNVKQGFDKIKIFEEIDYPAEKLLESALPWLMENKNEKFFLFLWFSDPHTPYTPPPPYDTLYNPDYDGREVNLHDVVLPKLWQKSKDDLYTRDGKMVTDEELQHVIDLYDGEITSLDNALGDLFERLKSLDLYDNTIIVFTADHGEAFNEHHTVMHCRNLYDDQIGVPLIFYIPKIGPKIIEDVAVNINIFPTLTDILNIKTPSSVQGTTLLPLMSSELEGNIADYSRWNNEITIKTEKWKLIFPDIYNKFYSIKLLNLIEKWKVIHKSIIKMVFKELPLFELYDLENDEKEINFLDINSNREVVNNLLRETISSQYSKKKEIEELDPEIVKKLKSLAYL